MYKVNFVKVRDVRDIKVLIAFLGMPHHGHLKSQHQFVVLIDMYLHAKNQLYTSKMF